MDSFDAYVGRQNLVSFPFLRIWPTLFPKAWKINAQYRSWNWNRFEFEYPWLE